MTIPMIQCLIIDDDRDDQEIFLMCIKNISKNITCIGIDDSTEAISRLKSDHTYTPDYIFIDVNMPKINGIGCLGILKKIDRLRETKIFMYSTTSEPSTFSESNKLGADGFIIKPAKVAELQEKLCQIFNIVPVLTK